jgi:hypothetical protein
MDKKEQASQPASRKALSCHSPSATDLGAAQVKCKTTAPTAVYNLRSTPQRTQEEYRPSRLWLKSGLDQKISATNDRAQVGLKAIDQLRPGQATRIRNALALAVRMTSIAAQEAASSGKLPSKAFAMVAGGDENRLEVMAKSYSAISEELKLLQSETPAQQARLVFLPEDTTSLAGTYDKDPLARIYLKEAFLKQDIIQMAATLIHEVSHITLGTDDHYYLYQSEYADLAEGMRGLKYSLADYFSSLNGKLMTHDPLTNADTWNSLAIDLVASGSPDILQRYLDNPDKPRHTVNFKSVEELTSVPTDGHSVAARIGLHTDSLHALLSLSADVAAGSDVKRPVAMHALMLLLSGDNGLRSSDAATSRVVHTAITSLGAAPSTLKAGTHAYETLTAALALINAPVSLGGQTEAISDIRAGKGLTRQDAMTALLGVLEQNYLSPGSTKAIINALDDLESDASQREDALPSDHQTIQLLESAFELRTRFQAMRTKELDALRGSANAGQSLQQSQVMRGLLSLLDVNKSVHFLSRDSELTVLRAMNEIDGSPMTLEPSHIAHVVLTLAFDQLVATLIKEDKKKA